MRIEMASAPSVMSTHHSLFPFNRTSIYLLMSPESSQQTPLSVILRGTSAQRKDEWDMLAENAMAWLAVELHGKVDFWLGDMIDVVGKAGVLGR